MARSVEVLRHHPENKEREAHGEDPANMIGLFWGSGRIPEPPSFKEIYGIDAAMTSGVSLLKGLAKMVRMENLDIPGVTDGLDNDYAAQAAGALKALQRCDAVFIHVEAPDEAAHSGHIKEKVEAIERVDREMLARLLSEGEDNLRMLVMPDHATPIEVRTHTSDPVPFVLWGPGFQATGAKVFSEAEARRSSIFIAEGYTLMRKLTEG